MTRKTIRTFLLALSVCLFMPWSSPVRAQNPISVNVTNIDFDRLNVVIYDDVCGQILFEGMIEGHTTIVVNSCSKYDGFYTNIRIWNQATGITQRYSGLRSGANVRLR